MGDYARRFADELIRQGHQAVLVGLSEPNLDSDDAASGYSELSPDSISKPTLQLSADTLWKTREKTLCEFLSQQKPDVISLQYVPYAFQRRGLPYGLAGWLRSVTPPGARWQIMFHEICVGLGNDSPRKHRVIGALQKRIAAGLIRTLQPVAVHSHAAPYLDILRQLGADAKPLSLFSNVEVIAKEQLQDHPAMLRDKEGFFDFAFFGTVHPDWDLAQVVEMIQRIARSKGRKARIIAIGKGGGYSNSTWQAFRGAGVDVIETGMVDEVSVSAHLSSCDFGLSGYPPDLIEKSSAAATLFAHGLKVIVPRNAIWGERYLAVVREGCPLVETDVVLKRPSEPPPNRNELPFVTNKFLADLLSISKPVAKTN